jgi:EAL and modified HD-GYP domain-containing signal transduction protein
MLEQLAGGEREAGTLFLVGMFSLLDAVFRMSLADILERVALSDEASQALLDRTGPYASALAFAEAYELGLFEHSAELIAEMGLDPARVGEFYASAIEWTGEALGSVLDSQTAAPARAAVGGRR